MKNLSLFLLLGTFLLTQSLGAAAEQIASVADPGELVAPVSALLSPNGARLFVTQKASVSIVNGKPFTQFVLPANAANLQLAVPGKNVVRWSATPVLLDHNSPLAGRRARIEKERVDISSRLMTVNARLAFWQALPKSANAQEVSQLQAAMQEEMPKLVLQQAELERRLKLVNEQLSRMPETSGIGERVTILLAGDIANGAEVIINYSYNHDSCGWEPIYDFNAKPDEGKGGVIDARMLAEVWQYTGMDWRNTEITIATQGFGPREPAPLPEWIVESSETKPQPRAALGSSKAVMPMTAEAVRADNTATAASSDTDAIYANWKLTEKGLPQGRSRMQIMTATWQAPMQWLARPGQHDNKVWLLAKYQLPKDQAWPAGLAEYSVNGQNIGSGEFRPHDNEAVLYFGADPRVTITTATDSRKHGESGIINTSKVWSWAYTYTIQNNHNQPIQVRVERPAPLIVDNDVTLVYKNNPAPLEDRKAHMIYWLVDVPAHGKKAIEYGITLSSPTKLPLLPDVP